MGPIEEAPRIARYEVPLPIRNHRPKFSLTTRNCSTAASGPLSKESPGRSGWTIPSSTIKEFLGATNLQYVLRPFDTLALS